MRIPLLALVLVMAWPIVAGVAVGLVVGLVIYGAGRWFTDGREAVRAQDRRHG